MNTHSNEIAALAAAAALSPKESARRFMELISGIPGGLPGLDFLPINPRSIKRQSQKHKRKKARQVRASGRNRRG